MAIDRIDNAALRSRTASPEEAAAVIKDGMTVAFGGYTSCGYPKTIADVLVKRRERGESLRINLVGGSQVGPEIYDSLANASILERCAPLIDSKALAKQVNAGQVHYYEQQMCRLPRLLANGGLGHLDVAVVEALGITPEGYIVPTNSVGMVPAFLKAADKVIIEVNTGQPEQLAGLADVFLPDLPPKTEPIPLTDVRQRIGRSHIQVNPEKIISVVITDRPESREVVQPVDSLESITGNLLCFLEQEAKNKWGGCLFPIQTGFGNLTNAILLALGESHFTGLEFFCGGVSENHVRLMADGRVRGISAGSLALSPYVLEQMRSNPEMFHEFLVLRNAEITNAAETVGRLGVIAVNTGIEVDIYGNLNASHITGNRVVNGIGGGAGFAQNALLSIVVIPSIAKGGDISSVVPMVSHHDIIEHDVDVLITENGVADLRGLDEVERARRIIANCAHETYRSDLAAYLDKAIADAGGHHPVLLGAALSWQQRLREPGPMRR